MTPILWGLVLFGFMTPVLHAQEPPGRPGTAVDAERTWIDPAKSTRGVQIITAEQIARSNARNLPDLLEREGAAWLTYVALAGGTPGIRAAIGNDILILLDGWKINNTAYRYGPLETLSTIDLQMLDRIEIVRSAAGAHGGDTLGPVIRLFSKRNARSLSGSAVPADPAARATFRFSKVDKASVAHLEGYHETDRHSAFFGLTTRDIGDLSGGKDTDFQRPTGYEEFGGNGRYQYFLSDKQTFEIDVQILEQQNVHRFDRLEQGTHIDYHFSPRKRTLFRISYLDVAERPWGDRLEASITLNQHRQRALEQRTSNPEIRTQFSDNNDTEGFALRVEKRLGIHQVTYGYTYLDEIVAAVGREIETLTGEELSRGTDRTRGGQTREQVSLWIEDTLELPGRFDLAAGARYQEAEVRGSMETGYGTFDLTTRDDGVAAFLTASWAATDTLSLVASFDHGFRLPGIDQVSGFTEDSLLTGLPNLTLEPVTVEAFEFGGRWISERVSAGIFLFDQHLDDLWGLLPAVEDPERAVRTGNVGGADITGFDVDAEIALPRGFDLFALFRSVEAEDETGTPLAGMPPDFGLFGLRWRGKGRFEPWAEGRLHWADDKTRLSPADLADPNFDPVSLAAYDDFEFRAGFTVPERFRFIMTVQNQGQRDFKRFGSALWAPGRNFVLAAEYVF